MCSDCAGRKELDKLKWLEDRKPHQQYHKSNECRLQGDRREWDGGWVEEASIETTTAKVKCIENEHAFYFKSTILYLFSSCCLVTVSFLPLGSVRLLHATDWNRTKVRYTHFGIVQNERTSRPYGIQCNCTWQVCRTHSAIERGREHHLQLETVFFGHKCSYSPGVLPTIKWVIVVSVTSYALVHNRDRFFGSLFVIWNAKHAYVRSVHIWAIWLLAICYQLYIRYDMEQKRTQQTKWRASYNFYSSFSPWSNVMCVRVENPIYSMAFLTVPLRHPLCLCVHCAVYTQHSKSWNN